MSCKTIIGVAGVYISRHTGYDPKNPDATRPDQFSFFREGFEPGDFYTRVGTAKIEIQLQPTLIEVPA